MFGLLTICTFWNLKKLFGLFLDILSPYLKSILSCLYMMENRPVDVFGLYFPLQHPRSYTYNISGIVFGFESFNKTLVFYILWLLLYPLPRLRVKEPEGTARVSAC